MEMGNLKFELDKNLVWIIKKNMFIVFTMLL